MPELKFTSSETEFKFFVSRKGYDDGGYFWTNAEISLNNAYINHSTGSNFLAFSELQAIERAFNKILSGEEKEDILLEFIEPDLIIEFQSKYKTAIFKFRLRLDGYDEDHYYSFPLGEEDMKKISLFLGEEIKKLK